MESCFTKFEEPAFSVRVKEGVSQIIPIILWDFERLVANALVQFLSRKEMNTIKKKRCKCINRSKQWGYKLAAKILLSSFTYFSIHSNWDTWLLSSVTLNQLFCEWDIGVLTNNTPAHSLKCHRQMTLICDWTAAETGLESNPDVCFLYLIWTHFHISIWHPKKSVQSEVKLLSGLLNQADAFTWIQ